MLNTIIYSATGAIILTTTQTGYGNISAVEVDVPDGCYVKSVNPENGQSVIEPIPKTEEQKRLDAIEAQMNALIGVNESEGAV